MFDEGSCQTKPLKESLLKYIYINKYNHGHQDDRHLNLSKVFWDNKASFE